MSPEAAAAQRITRKERKAATRKQLRQAAFRCFAEKGYASTQIADIAKAAGVAHGTFYVHFEGKEQLVREALEAFNQGLVERLAGSWEDAAAGDPERVLRACAKAFLDHWEENRAFIRACAEKAVAGISFEELRDGVSPPAVEFLSSGLQALALRLKARLPSPLLVTHGLLGIWLRVGLQAVFNPGVDRREAERVLVRLTAGALEGVLPGAMDPRPAPALPGKSRG